MKKRLLFVYNIHSGKGTIKRSMADISDIFIKAGYEVIVYSTQKPNDAREKVIEYADKVDAVACAGGDGTANEIVSGIMNCKKELPLFYLPAGSTNDYAASLGIPRRVAAAAEMAVEGNIRHIDIGRFNETYFNYIAAFGFLTDISYGTDQNLKNKLGYGAYVLEVSKRLFNIPVLNMKIKIGDRVYDDGWFYGMVTNSTCVGGLKNITGKDVKFDDGLMEVTLVKATTNPIEFMEALNSIASGAESRFVVRDKASKIEITSKEAVKWTLDGEDGGAHTEITIEDMKQALAIALPEKANGNFVNR